jgi:hypothetical protein
MPREPQLGDVRISATGESLIAAHSVKVEARTAGGWVPLRHLRAVRFEAVAGELAEAMVTLYPVEVHFIVPEGRVLLERYPSAPPPDVTECYPIDPERLIFGFAAEPGSRVLWVSDAAVPRAEAPIDIIRTGTYQILGTGQFGPVPGCCFVDDARSLIRLGAPPAGKLFACLSKVQSP